jgi:hypothetical protein
MTLLIMMLYYALYGDEAISLDKMMNYEYFSSQNYIFNNIFSILNYQFFMLKISIYLISEY